MKILLVHNFYKIPGGEDSVFKNELKLLKEKGNEVYTYTRDNSDMKAADLIFSAPFSKRTYREVRKLIEEKQIDLVHIHNDRFLISPSVFRAAYDQKVPAIQTLHNFRPLCINAMLTREGGVCRECLKENKVIYTPAIKHGCYRNSGLLTRLALRINKNAYRMELYDRAYFIALTDFNKEIFAGSGFKGDRIFVKPNFTFLSGDHSQNALERDSKKSGFVYLGRLDPLKGIEDILSEWKSVPDDIILNIAGTGEEAYVSSLKNKYSMNNVRFLGSLEHERAMELLRSSKAMIFASCLYEGFPMTIIESFLNGTPVIGRNFGNGGDVIKKVYKSSAPLIDGMEGLHKRIISFDDDCKRGLYDFDSRELEDYTPDRNYEILSGIYEEVIKYYG